MKSRVCVGVELSLLEKAMLQDDDTERTVLRALAPFMDFSPVASKGEFGVLAREDRTSALGTRSLAGLIVDESRDDALRAGCVDLVEILRERLPGLPVEREGRLVEPEGREHFVERVFAYQRVRELFSERWNLGDLVKFHTAEKLVILAHSPACYRELGSLVGGAKDLPREDLARRYQELFLSAYEERATRMRHVNVLQHMAGYFRGLASAEDRHELEKAIDDYAREQAPLAGPLTVVRRLARIHAVAYLEGQRYLEA